MVLLTKIHKGSLIELFMLTELIHLSHNCNCQTCCDFDIFFIFFCAEEMMFLMFTVWDDLLHWGVLHKTTWYFSIIKTNWLSWHAKSSFKSTKIRCVIDGTIQTASKMYLSLVLDYYTNVFQNKVSWGTPEGAEHPLSLHDFSKSRDMMFVNLMTGS